MAHFARLDDDNIVTLVTVVSNADILDENGIEKENLGVAICETVVGPGRWLQTSYNGTFRRRYGQVGFTYDHSRDAFLHPQPFPSWVLDDNDEWQAPIPIPDDGGAYIWNEETRSWDLIPLSEMSDD